MRATARASAAANPTRSDRIALARERAVLATLNNQRSDLLLQLHSHMGSKAFAQALTHLSAEQQHTALNALSAERRAAVYRVLSPTQRELWHKACKQAFKREQLHPLMRWLSHLLRACAGRPTQSAR